MPRNFVVARRYAEALVDAFELEKSAGPVLEELEVFKKLYLENQVARFFESPVIPASEKIAAIDVLAKWFPNMLSFLRTLVSESRIDLFLEILSETEALIEERSGQVQIHVELADKALEGSIEEIRTILQDKWKRKVRLTTSVNPDLIAGFVARGGGRVLDASSSYQLEVLKSSVEAR